MFVNILKYYGIIYIVHSGPICEYMLFLHIHISGVGDSKPVLTKYVQEMKVIHRKLI